MLRQQITIERTPVDDRLPKYSELFELFVATVERNKLLEKEVSQYKSLVKDYTRVQVENRMLKDQLKRMEECTNDAKRSN